MDAIVMIHELEKGLGIIQALFAGMTREETRAKPDAGSWSSLEVLCHLVDEEREDFRRHIEQAFSDCEEEWHPIDPEGWVIERRYQAQPFEEKLSQFKQERAQSLRWLDEMATADWTREITAPFGTISAGSLLASWAAHDNLHIRQLVELRQHILENKCRPESIRYAGEW